MALDFGISGKNYLITGANSGIGRGIALMLGQQGANVAVHYLPTTKTAPGAAHTAFGEAAASEVVSAIRECGGRATALPGDLSKEVETACLIAGAEQAIGPLAGLVNNAAACELPDTVLEAEWGRYRRHYDVNLAAPTLLMSAFARALSGRSQGSGSIVNVSTDAAQAFPGQVFYGTSKAALEAMTRVAAIELGPLGITVNAVAPGPVQTGYIDDALARTVIPSIPLRRLGTPEDVAAAVLFLLSDASAWITGQIIQVAGGHAL